MKGAEIKHPVPLSVLKTIEKSIKLAADIWTFPRERRENGSANLVNVRPEYRGDAIRSAAGIADARVLISAPCLNRAEESQLSQVTRRMRNIDQHLQRKYPS